MDIAKPEELKNWFVEAVKHFYKTESRLLTDDVCERALVFRLGIIIHLRLEEENKKSETIKKLSVYSEYNKAHQAGQSIPGAKSIDRKTYTYPDLIIISGFDNGSEDNILVVEAKKVNNPDIVSDKDKLTQFTCDETGYKYKVGAHLFFDEDSFLIVWYSKGQAVSVEQWNFNSGVWLQSLIHKWGAVLDYERYSDLRAQMPYLRRPEDWAETIRVTSYLDRFGPYGFECEK